MPFFSEGEREAADAERAADRDRMLGLVRTFNIRYSSGFTLKLHVFAQ